MDFGLMPGRPARASRPIEEDPVERLLLNERADAPFILSPAPSFAHRAARALCLDSRAAFPSEFGLSFVQAERLLSAGILDRRDLPGVDPHVGRRYSLARAWAVRTLARKIAEILSAANDRR